MKVLKSIEQIRKHLENPENPKAYIVAEPYVSPVEIDKVRMYKETGIMVVRTIDGIWAIVADNAKVITSC